jgi:hypothetical protein
MRPTETGQGQGAGREEHVEELLDAWRTGELDPARSEHVASHLEGCAACRAELKRLGPWTDAIERGFAARRSEARELEPDWAAQRAAIVARTSGRARSAGRRAFWRWAPQIAVVALAALIVGIVWRENPREPGAERSAESLRDAVEAPTAAGPSGAEDGAMERDADAAGGREAEREQDARGVPPPVAPAAPPPSADAPAAAPSAAEEELERARPEEKAGLDAVGNERREEVLADQALEPARQAFLEPGGRFDAAARAALVERDTLAARRALALWSDSLAPAERLVAPRAALADSLERLLDAGP